MLNQNRSWSNATPVTLSLSLRKCGNENITLSLFAFKFYGCIKIRKQMQLVFFLISVSALIYFPRFSY